MNNWKLKYLGEQLQKINNNKYQFTLTGLFIFDKDLYEYQPKTEYTVKNYRIDLYYKSIKMAIEVDEPFHMNNKEEDKKREEEIKKEISGIKIRRINILEDDWHGQYIKIKKEILLLKSTKWNESDIVDNFKKIKDINIREIGNQINSISKYIFANNAIATNNTRYNGVYLNKGNNSPGNYYIAIVCYKSDIKNNEAKISFVVYDMLAIKNQNKIVTKNKWQKTKRTIDCLIKYLNIDRNYIIKSKEEQFKILESFIIKQFKEIDNTSPKIV